MTELIAHIESVYGWTADKYQLTPKFTPGDIEYWHIGPGNHPDFYVVIECDPASGECLYGEWPKKLFD